MDFELHTNERLSKYTTLQIGGPAKYVAVVKSEAELTAALQFAAANTATPPFILGGGSNVLCSDVGYPGMVIVNQLSGYEILEESDTSVSLTVGAGEVFDEIVAKTVADGYWGLENLSAIPGSVGATPIQNVGAYGVEVAECITEVAAVHLKTLEKNSFKTADCQFAYRDSFFKSPAGKAWCVTSVTYQLSKQPKPILAYKDLQPLQAKHELSQSNIRDAVMAVRSKKFPDWNKVGTAGSFFKNPIITTDKYQALLKDYPELPGFVIDDTQVKVSLGWILDKVCNLKGYRVGPVGLYEAQALVLVTEAGATAAAVNDFVEHVTAVVKEKTDIEIEREVLSV